MLPYKPAYDRSYALVIGIDYYVNDRNLKTAVRGAEAVGARLSELGFAVDRLLDRDATRDAILDWLDRLAERAGPDDRVFVYYAGHAMSRKRRDARNLPPVGYLKLYNTLTYSNALSMEDLLGEARFIAAKHKFFALDCCFSGLAIPKAEAPAPTARPVEALLRASAVEVLTAGGEKDKAADRLRRSQHSPFTHYLLRGLQGGARQADGAVTSDSLAAYVIAQMRANKRVRQTPAFYREGRLEDGEVGGFVFVMAGET